MEPTEPVGRGAVALAVYRPDPGLLRTQLETLQAQTVTRWRCHVGIDGTDDATAALVRTLTERDERFVIHHYPRNVGFYRNFERLLQTVEPDAAWVALSDQDDDWGATKLERLVAALARPGVTAVLCQARVVTREGAVVGRTARRAVRAESLLWDNQVTGSLAVFAPEVVRRALPFPAPSAAAYHDHWLGLVASCLGTVVVLDEPLQRYVQHDANVLGERAGGGRAARVRSVLRGGPRQGLRVLAIERWGWRRTMAQTVVHRVPRSGTGVLRDVAAGRLSRGVLVAMSSSVLRDHASGSRVGALLVGALASQAMDAASPRGPRTARPQP